jgi:polyhydroxybutyrate depolymerase
VTLVAAASACGEAPEEGAIDRQANSNAPSGSDRPLPDDARENGQETQTTPSPSSGTPIDPPAVRVTSETLDLGDGGARSFVLAVPTTYTAARSYPLVVVLHGDGGTGEGIRAAYRIDDFSAANALVVYPSGRDGTWDLYTESSVNADVAFMIALVDHLAGRFAVDHARVFGAGFSKGAFFANQVACRMPALFRGIAANAGGAPYEPQDPSATYWPNGYVQCAGQTTGVAALVIHGEGDPVVTVDGGDFDATYWAYVNGCGTERAPSATAPCLAHQACPADKPVIFCPIPGLGHTVWSHAAEVSWAFFASL